MTMVQRCNCDYVARTFNNTTAVAVSSNVTVIVHSSHKELIANLEKLRDELKKGLHTV